jgi:hypothetical protein
LKSEGLPDTPLGAAVSADHGTVRVGRLLVLRSTASTRQLARDFEATLGAAYPARTADVLDSLLRGGPWPGAGIVWMTIDKGEAQLVRRRLAGVGLGR